MQNINQDWQIVSDISQVQQQQDNVIYLIGQIGQGGFGKVYACKLNDLILAFKLTRNNNNQFCLKIEYDIFKELQQHDIECKYFLKIHKYAGRYLQQENIIEEYILSDYMREGCLNQLVKKQFHCLIDSQISDYYFIHLMKGLSIMHQQEIYHFDIKDENLLINNEFQIRIGDYGLCRTKEQYQKQPKQLGTPIYMSPELIKMNNMQNNQNKIDGIKCDIYSAGVTFFKLKFGFYPFYDLSLEQQVPKILYREQYERDIPNYWNQVYNIYRANCEQLKLQQSQRIDKAQFMLLVNLFNSMLHQDPSQRIGIEEILEHNYFQNQVLLNEDEVFKKVYNKIRLNQINLRQNQNRQSNVGDKSVPQQLKGEIQKIREEFQKLEQIDDEIQFQINNLEIKVLEQGRIQQSLNLNRIQVQKDEIIPVVIYTLRQIQMRDFDIFRNFKVIRNQNNKNVISHVEATAQVNDDSYNTDLKIIIQIQQDNEKNSEILKKQQEKLQKEQEEDKEDNNEEQEKEQFYGISLVYVPDKEFLKQENIFDVKIQQKKQKMKDQFYLVEAKFQELLKIFIENEDICKYPQDIFEIKNLVGFENGNASESED